MKGESHWTFFVLASGFFLQATLARELTSKPQKELSH